jgi:tetratricopeptide (TPR) repeat protein
MSTSEIAKLESRWRENPNGLTFAPLAEAYRKQKDLQRALDILFPGLEKHPDYIPANIVLGRCYWDLNDLSGAERAFTYVLGLDSENVIALKALADITERLVRYDESVRWLGALLVVDRSNDEAQAQLARVHELQRQQAEGSAAVPQGAAEVAEAAPAVAEEPVSATIEPTFAEPPSVVEAVAPPEAFEPSPEPPAPEEASSVEYIGWVARPDDLNSPPAALPIEDLEADATHEAFAAAESTPDPSSTPPRPAEPAEHRFAATTTFPDPDVDTFGLEQPEEIVLNISGQTEYQTPSAVDDLMAHVTGTPPGIDDLRRDLAPPEPITSALPGFTPRVNEPFANPEPEPVLDIADHPDAAPPPVGPTADFYSLDEPPAYADVAADSDPADAPPADAPAPESAAELDDAPAGAEPELVVTETMAEVFLRQGHLPEAITVYRELVRRGPAGGQLASRLADLEARQAAESAPRPRRAYAARETGGQSVAAFFETLLRGRPEDLPPRWPARPEPPAPEPPPEEASATRPAGEPLSLGSVFGDEPPPVAPAMGRPSGETAAPGGPGGGSFDDFFGAPAKGAGPSPPPVPGRPHARSGDDLDQFHAWLQGLKR